MEPRPMVLLVREVAATRTRLPYYCHTMSIYLFIRTPKVQVQLPITSSLVVLVLIVPLGWQEVR
jgi:hypothetical protein